MKSNRGPAQWDLLQLEFFQREFSPTLPSFQASQIQNTITVEPAARLVVDYLSCLYGQREPKAWIRLMNQLIPFADDEVQSSVRQNFQSFFKEQRKIIAMAELLDEPFSGWWDSVCRFLKKISYIHVVFDYWRNVRRFFLIGKFFFSF